MCVWSIEFILLFLIMFLVITHYKYVSKNEITIHFSLIEPRRGLSTVNSYRVKEAINCEQQTQFFSPTLISVSTKRSVDSCCTPHFCWLNHQTWALHHEDCAYTIRRMVPRLQRAPSYADIEDHWLAFTSSSTAINLFVLLSIGTSQSLAIHNLDHLAVIRPSLRYYHCIRSLPQWVSIRTTGSSSGSCSLLWTFRQ